MSDSRTPSSGGPATTGSGATGSGATGSGATGPKQKIDDAAHWKDHAFSEQYRNATFPQNKTVYSFKKLDLTPEEEKKLADLKNVNGLVADDPQTELLTPGLYSVHNNMQSTNFHIRCSKDAAGLRVNPVFNRTSVFAGDPGYDASDKDVEESYLACVDFIVKATNATSITFDWDNPDDVSSKHLRHAMNACLNRGLEVQFGKNTKIALDKMPLKEREMWYKFRDDINAHAQKRQLLYQVNDKVFKDLAEPLNKTPKLDPTKTDREELKKDTFSKRSDKAFGKEQGDELSKQIDDAQARIDKLTKTSNSITSKMQGWQKTLKDPNLLQTEIDVPKDQYTGFSKMIAHTFLGFGVPLAIYRAVTSRVEKSKKGSLSGQEVTAEINGIWKDAEPQAKALVDAAEKEIRDLRERQQLIAEEINRYKSLDSMKGYDKPEDKKADEDRVNEINKQLKEADDKRTKLIEQEKDLTNKLGDLAKPENKAKLERQKAVAQAESESINKELASKHKELASKIEAYQTGSEALKEKEALLLTKNEMHDDIKSTMQQLNDLEGQTQEYKSELDAVKEKMRTANDEDIPGLEKEKQTLEDQIVQCENLNKDLNATLEKEKASLKTLDERQKQLEGKIKLSQDPSAIPVLQKQVEALEARKEALEHNDPAKLEKKLQEIKAELAKPDSLDRKDLEKQKNEISARLQSAASDQKPAQDQLKGLEEKNKKLMDAIKKQDDAIAKFKNEFANMNEAINEANVKASHTAAQP